MWLITGFIVWLIGLPFIWHKLVKECSCLPCQKIALTIIWPLMLIVCCGYSIISKLYESKAV